MRRDANYEILSEDFNCFPPRKATWKRINCIPFNKRLSIIFDYIRKLLQNFIIAKLTLVEKYTNYYVYYIKWKTKQLLKISIVIMVFSYYKSNLWQKII